METKWISVKSRGDIKVSQKTKKPYFFITDQDGIKYGCYKVSLHNDFGVDKEGEIEFNPPNYADGTNSLVGWHGVGTTPEATQPNSGVVKPKPQQLAPKEKAMPSKESADMTKNDWAEKERITRKSIERQKSLEMAVELAKLMGADKATTEKIIATAKKFEEYLEGKAGLATAKSSLVEEAKKLGAVEEEPKQ